MKHGIDCSWRGPIPQVKLLPAGTHFSATVRACLSAVESKVMKSAQITIINKLGLHARAAAKLVQLSNQFSSTIRLEKDGEEADAKSMMEVLMLAAIKDSEMRIVAEGRDEGEALEEISGLINNKFEEDE